MQGTVTFRGDNVSEGVAFCMTEQGDDKALPVEKSGDEYIITLPQAHLCLICLK